MHISLIMEKIHFFSGTGKIMFVHYRILDEVSRKVRGEIQTININVIFAWQSCGLCKVNVVVSSGN